MDIKLDFEQARAKHLLFKSRLRAILYGIDIDEAPVLSHHECNVGKWIYDYALKTYGEVPEMQEFEKVHADIHISARKLVALYKEGKVEEAREGLSEMEEIADKLVKKLGDLQQKLEEKGVASVDRNEDLKIKLNEFEDILKANIELDKRIKEQVKAIEEANHRFEAKAKEAQSAHKVLHDFFMNTPAVLAILKGREHVFELANRDYLEFVGRDDIIGKTVREALPEIEGQGFFELLDNVYKTGEPFIGKEVPVKIKKNNKEHEAYVNFMYQAFKDINNKVQGILVFAYDVTEQVVSRLEAQKSEKQFIDLAENMPQLAWIADETGYIFWYNQRWYNYTNTTPEQMQGWGWQSVHDQEILPSVLERWKKSIDSGLPFEMVFPLKGGDNVFRPFLTRVIPLKDNTGKIVRWFGTNTDITEQKKIEEALRESEQKLKQSYEDLETKVIFRNLELERLNKKNEAKIKELEEKLAKFSQKLT